MGYIKRTHIHMQSHTTMQTITSLSSQATGSTTDTDILICGTAMLISTMSNHIAALQLKYVRCLFWLHSGIWGSVPASRVNSGQERLFCVCMYVCIFQQVCVSACQDCASHKTDAGVRMNHIQSAISSLQHSERLVEGERQKTHRS